MTKKDLVELLSQFPDDAKILINGYEGGYQYINSIAEKFVYYDPSLYCGDYREWDEDDAKEYNGIPASPDFKAVVLNRQNESD